MDRREVLAAAAVSMGGVASLPTVLGHQSPEIEITIVETDSPVAGGERLTVQATAENTTSHRQPETLYLLDSSNNILDKRRTALIGGEKQWHWLDYTTYDTKRDVTFPITVAGEHDSDSQDVTVVARDPDAGLGVSIFETTAPVHAGERLDVFVDLANGAQHEVTDTITLTDSSGNVLDTREETLARESTQVSEVGYETYPVKKTVTFPVTVSTSVDSDSEEVTVYGTG